MEDLTRTSSWEYYGAGIWAEGQAGQTDGGVRPDPDPEPVRSQPPGPAILNNTRDRIHRHHPAHLFNRIRVDLEIGPELDSE